MRGLRQLGTALGLALAALTAAALISACGGGGDDIESDSSRAATTTTTTANSTQADDISKAKIGGKTALDRGPQQTRSKSQRKKDVAKLPADSTDNRRDNGTPRNRPERVAGGNCSASQDSQGCAEIGAVYEQAKKEDPEVVAADECPAAMTPDQCAEAGRVHQEAEGNGQIVPPSECPPAMTDQQCEEAGRAYQEALR